MTKQIVEHIVLFKIKDAADPSEVKAMFDGLNGLISLDPVLHLTAGPLLRIRSTSLVFTHMLHARYNTKEDLNSYMVHPNHLSLVQKSASILDDIMAVDWVVDDFSDTITPPPGSAIRVTFFKPLEELGDQAKNDILQVTKSVKNLFEAIDQTTCGHNFSARAKGFSIASLIVFPGVKEMEMLYSNKELVNSQKEKIRKFVESTAVVEYLIPPSSQSA